MDDAQLGQVVLDAVTHAMCQNDEALAGSLAAIEQVGPWAMFGACCGWADCGHAALRKLYGERAADLAQGDMWALQELVPGKSRASDLFASRFIVAWANGDQPMALALFRSAVSVSEDAYGEAVISLLMSVAGLVRLATDSATT
jgi:hypothetical protein